MLDNVRTVYRNYKYGCNFQFLRLHEDIVFKIIPFVVIFKHLTSLNLVHFMTKTYRVLPPLNYSIGKLLYSEQSCIKTAQKSIHTHYKVKMYKIFNEFQRS